MHSLSSHYLDYLENFTNKGCYNLVSGIMSAGRAVDGVGALGAEKVLDVLLGDILVAAVFCGLEECFDASVGANIFLVIVEAGEE